VRENVADQALADLRHTFVPVIGSQRFQVVDRGFRKRDAGLRWQGLLEAKPLPDHIEVKLFPRLYVRQTLEITARMKARSSSACSKSASACIIATPRPRLVNRGPVF
jgi:hypothetical protein